MNIKIIKFNEDIIMPQRAHSNDAGIDVYIQNAIQIKAHKTKAIPLGFGLEVPIGMMACVFPRSSLTKKGYISHVPPIDSGYTGEIHAVITNTTNDDVSFIAGAKVAQLVFIPIALPNLVIEFGEVRGNGAFGSTDK